MRGRNTVVNRDVTKMLISEFLGPFALVFMGVGAIIQTQGNGLVAIAFAHGLGLGLVILAAGHYSGGHYNPAVTIGFWAVRRIDTKLAIYYIIAQCLGGLAAAGALVLVYPDLDRNKVNLGVPAVGKALTTGESFGVGRPFVIEIILTFFLMFVIFGTAVDIHSGGRMIAGLAIGLAVTMDIFAGGVVSGAAMNPARWFGPAVVQQDWSDFWIWWAGPIIGAVAAALVYNYLLLGNRADTAPSRVTIDETPAEELEREAVDQAQRQQPRSRSRRAQRRR
jgi:aquaporin Z